MTVSDIGREILGLPHAEWVTISGGNPVLHDLGKLVDLLHANDFLVAVETQGSIWKPWLLQIDRLTVSPKPPSSGMVNPFLSEFLDHAINGAPACIKIPVYNIDDLNWAEQIHLEYPEFDFYLSIVTEMGGLHGDFAEGRIDTEASLLGRYRSIAELVLQRPAFSDARIIPQLHYLIWGNVTGV
jgi:7-carboxy-7-deazaguanine synthase